MMTARIPPTCRRRSAREPAVDGRARLEWDGTAGRGCDARIVDISRSGALLHCEGGAPSRGPVRLRPGWPASPGWLRATVVRTGGPHRLGLEFADPCPDDVLLAVTLGIGFDHLLGGPARG
jgi:hypothetical protein